MLLKSGYPLVWCALTQLFTQLSFGEKKSEFTSVLQLALFASIHFNESLQLLIEKLRDMYNREVNSQ